MSIYSFSKDKKWNRNKNSFVKKDNSWKEAFQIYVKNNNTWKPVWNYKYVLINDKCSITCGGANDAAGYITHSFACMKDDNIQVDDIYCKKNGIEKPISTGEECFNQPCSNNNAKYIISVDGYAFFFESDPNGTIGRPVFRQHINYRISNLIGEIYNIKVYDGYQYFMVHLVDGPNASISGLYLQNYVNGACATFLSGNRFLGYIRDSYWYRGPCWMSSEKNETLDVWWHIRIKA